MDVSSSPYIRRANSTTKDIELLPLFKEIASSFSYFHVEPLPRRLRPSVRSDPELHRVCGRESGAIETRLPFTPVTEVQQVSFHGSRFYKR